MKTYVVNFFAGPGAGKSTLSSHLFAELKWMGYKAELALEFAKELVWEESYTPLDNQIYLFGNQLQRIRRLQGKVDFVITDSPLPLSAIFDKSGSKNFYNLIFEVFRSFDNVNFFVKRVKKYEQAGRIHTNGESLAIDKQVKDVLDVEGINYTTIVGTPHVVPSLISIMKQRIGGLYDGI